jgi:hypothetical protein
MPDSMVYLSRSHSTPSLRESHPSVIGSDAAAPSDKRTTTSRARPTQRRILVGFSGGLTGSFECAAALEWTQRRRGRSKLRQDRTRQHLTTQGYPGCGFGQTRLQRSTRMTRLVDAAVCFTIAQVQARARIRTMAHRQQQRQPSDACARDPRRKQMRKIKHRFLSGRSGTLSQPGKALPGAKSQCMRLDLTV